MGSIKGEVRRSVDKTKTSRGGKRVKRDEGKWCGNGGEKKTKR
jgi:hypothetical protein